MYHHPYEHDQKMLGCRSVCLCLDDGEVQYLHQPCLRHVKVATAFVLGLARLIRFEHLSHPVTTHLVCRFEPYAMSTVTDACGEEKVV